MSTCFLGIDAGGSATRAVVVLDDGTCLARSRQAGGNPTSRGADAALRAVVTAAGEATARARQVLGHDVVVRGCLLAMAGEPAKLDTAALARSVSLPPDAVRPVSDVEAMYFAGACEPEGTAVVAGTGSVAVHIRDAVVAETAGGAGWLLGDGGSGFWIGQAVVQAVVADLSGLGPATAMTGRVLASLRTPGAAEAPGAPGVGGRIGGAGQSGPAGLNGPVGPVGVVRSAGLEALVRETYAQPPVHLARFAPIAFAHASDHASTRTSDHASGHACAGPDDVARRILARAGEHLAALVNRFPSDGPLVLGGSVMTQGFLRNPGCSPALDETLRGRNLRVVENGCAGAAFLALDRSGRAGRERHERIRSTLSALPDQDGTLEP
ncbi:hypothetical protein KIH74_06810 [Kineosporia sp. J2-2]|uniref:ATPase BadF/BadG/BcrA/BcrD type domain-containing protein n=1 Tax=Kineosporia corallincola TaxID=2835133 RepID=A0ABS5TC31_9ACTN|nr:BadF/BadG/BcrA/BcrD ATPase family protein [Kineosporia corallincola]MBT0768630.1 hypothetical protein [Kineosporia corallincola]